jgi:hypothetical protein
MFRNVKDSQHPEICNKIMPLRNSIKKNLPSTIEVNIFVDVNGTVGCIYGKGNTFYLFLDINSFCRLYYDSRP